MKNTWEKPLRGNLTLELLSSPKFHIELLPWSARFPKINFKDDLALFKPFNMLNINFHNEFHNIYII